MGVFGKIIKKSATKIAKEIGTEGGLNAIETLAAKIKHGPSRELVKLGTQAVREVIDGAASMTPIGKIKATKNIVKLGKETMPHVKETYEDVKPYVSEAWDKGKDQMKTMKEKFIEKKDKIKEKWQDELPTKQEMKDTYHFLKKSMGKADEENSADRQ